MRFLRQHILWGLHSVEVSPPFHRNRNQNRNRNRDRNRVSNPL